jgi:hypothetical protein
MFVQNHPVWDHLCNYCATAPVLAPQTKLSKKARLSRRRARVRVTSLPFATRIFLLLHTACAAQT